MHCSHLSRHIIADSTTMSLKLNERERVNDSVLLIESAKRTLERVEPAKIPNFDEIQNCLQTAVRDALDS